MAKLKNNEKAQRNYKKKKLQQKVRDTFDIWLSSRDEICSRTDAKLVRNELRRLGKLQKGWTDEEYNAAGDRLSAYKSEVLGESISQLMQDLWPGTVVKKPTEAQAEQLEKVFNVVSLMRQSLNLARLKPAEEAAVLRVLMHSTGLRLLQAGEQPVETDGNAWCLALLSIWHKKPDWVEQRVKGLAEKNCQDLHAAVYQEPFLE